MSTNKTALLLMDFHRAIVDGHGAAGHAAVSQTGRALDAARRTGLAVLHVVPHYRNGYPELPQGAPFDAVRAAGLFAEPHIAMGIIDALAPQPNEPVIAKSRYSPFWANDLLSMLHTQAISHLVLTGIATSGVVLSAVRDAWDRDYRVTVLSDCCCDPDPAVHATLINKIFPQQATVIDVAVWEARIGDSGKSLPA